jgi:hypothetical protein
MRFESNSKKLFRAKWLLLARKRINLKTAQTLIRQNCLMGKIKGGNDENR